MSVRWYYMDETATAVELTDRIWTPLDVSSCAEELNADQSELVIEDPDADLVLFPRRMYAVDDDAPSEHTVIWMGSIADIHIRRSEVYFRTATCRAWHLTLTDLNPNLTRFLFDEDDSANRDAETDLERLAWLMATSDVQTSGSGDNTDHIATTGGVDLDAHDFAPADSIPEGAYDVLRDMMDQSGRNCFMGYDEAKGPPDFDVSELGELFIFYDEVGADHWTSDMFLSNDPADIDPANGVFPLGEDDLDLHFDPTQVYSRLIGAYDGGKVEVNDATISADYTVKETALTMPLVTTEATATARANRVLQAGRDPSLRIEWGYTCGPAYVNALMAGQTFQYRATHLGGLEDLGAPDFTVEGGVRMRSMRRNVRQIGPSTFYVSGDGAVHVGEVPEEPEPSACAAEATPTGSFAPLNSGLTTDEVYYFRAGVAGPREPSPGDAGLPGAWHFSVAGSGGTPDFAGLNTGNIARTIVVGAGTLTVHTVSYDGPQAMRARLQHYNEDTVLDITDETQDGNVGDSFTFDVDTHGGAECIHWVDVYQRGTATPGTTKWGYAGADWVSTE